MISSRCKMFVKTELDKLGLSYDSVELGEVEVKNNITIEQHEQLKFALSKLGFELTEDKKSMFAEKMKNVIDEMLLNLEELTTTKHSTYISEKLNHNYAYLSKFFLAEIGITIENYIIVHKIERVKALLLDEFSPTKISYMLNYSSVAHLSNQFKKVTGITPRNFIKSHVQKFCTFQNV
jgi:YesN/AraC family two-component response regulator